MNRISALITKADALLITAGAGMSRDCGPPDNADLAYLQARFDATGHTKPHDGYRILRAWAQAPAMAIDTESLEVQGELPRCPHCGALARPNVLMYDD